MKPFLLLKKILNDLKMHFKYSVYILQVSVVNDLFDN